MFSTIKKMIDRVRSIDRLNERIARIEAKIKEYEGFATENEALWEFLDEQKTVASEMFVGTADELEDEISDLMLRNMKTQGDA